jgi:hypothetical protein
MRVSVEGSVYELGEAKSRLLAAELTATARKGAEFDAEGAARMSRVAVRQTIEFDDAQALAVLRAVDNLRAGGRLRGALALPRLRRALISHLAAPVVEYELTLTRDRVTSEASFVSYSGHYAVGDRLLTPEGTWTVDGIESREDTNDRLICVPFQGGR